MEGAQRSIVVTVFKEKFTQGNQDTLANVASGTVSFGPALNVDLVASLKGCPKC